MTTADSNNVESPKATTSTDDSFAAINVSFEKVSNTITQHLDDIELYVKAIHSSMDELVTKTDEQIKEARVMIEASEAEESEI